MKAKKTAKRARKSPSKPERKLWGPDNPYGESPYWVPPYMEVELTKASIYTMGKDGASDGFDSHIYTGAKVKIGGEFARLNIDTEGLADDLKKAIDEVIRKHTKIKPNKSTTMLKGDN